MFADIPQEFYERHRAKPLAVVQEEGAGLWVVKIQKSRHLNPLTVPVSSDLIFGKEGALLAFPTRISNQTRAAAHEHNGPPAESLQMGKQHQRHEVTDLEARRRGVKAYVAGNWTLSESLLEFRGRIKEQSAPLQLAQKFLHRRQGYAREGLHTGCDT